VKHFGYLRGELHVEAVPLGRIAEQFGTPCYVYSRAALTAAYRAFEAAFAARDHLICYAVKANSNLAILNLLARLGSGFDIVSGGELERVLAAGGSPGKVVFSGVGKTAEEMHRALAAGVMCFNVESGSELARLDRVAGEAGRIAPISVRVNPDVDAGTHPYIATGLRQNKFGVACTEALALYRRARDMAHVRIEGIDCHIGSQLTELAPFTAALQRVLELADRLQADGTSIAHVDVGGGLGIRYQPGDDPPDVETYARELIACLGKRPYKLLIEPGRAVVGNAGILLTRVEYLKPGADRNFAVVDAAMNDLMRPALYEAWHEVRTVRRGAGTPRNYEIVGPVCESGDFLARDRMLALDEGDLLAIMSAGAYGMSMSSNYNTRARAAEIMVDGDKTYLIRERETVTELMAREILLP
jgi:diaminopimelate decarboxylase